jgi:hypothetical protein
MPDVEHDQTVAGRDQPPGHVEALTEPDETDIHARSPRCAVPDCSQSNTKRPRVRTEAYASTATILQQVEQRCGAVMCGLWLASISKCASRPRRALGNWRNTSTGPIRRQ